jgi:hypothetical protein
MKLSRVETTRRPCGEGCDVTFPFSRGPFAVASTHDADSLE